MDEPFPKGMLQSIADALKHGLYEIDGLDTYPKIFSNPHMFPLQRPAELARMIQIARTISPGTIMEIGSDKAGGLYHWCKSILGIKRVIGCEIRGTPYFQLFQEAFPAIEFFWLPMSSYETGAIHATQKFMNNIGRRRTLKKSEKAECKGVIDILFIDGDKSHFDTDFDRYLPLMNPDGIVFMHDITDPAPGEAYEKIINRGYQHEEIIDRSDWEAAEKRERAGIPSSCEHESWMRHWKGKSCGVGVIYLSGKTGSAHTREHGEWRKS